MNLLLAYIICFFRFELNIVYQHRWSKIARRLPGRTDNEIKNYWRTHFRKKEDTQSYGRYSFIDLSSLHMLIFRSAFNRKNDVFWCR